jgi:hypothetical protein
LQQAAWWQITLIALLAVGILIASVWLLATYWPAGTDYYNQYYPVSHKWLRGETQLYDEQAEGFYQPPWVIWLILPFTIWPFEIGRALLWIASIAIIAVGVFVFSPPGRHRPWALAFAIFNLFTFDLQFRSQIDALALLGIILGWIAVGKGKPWLLALAYISMAIKVPNTIPTALFFLWLTLKHWRLRDVAVSLILPAMMVLSTFLVFPGWVPRWREFMQLTPPLFFWRTTIWRIADFFSLPRIVPWVFVALTLSVSVWAWIRAGEIGHVRLSSDVRDRVTLARLMIVMTCTFVVTPYALSYHFILLLAVVLPVLAGWRMSIAVGLYLLTYSPLVRVFLEQRYAWIDTAFVLALFVATIAYVFSESQKDTQDMVPDPTP